MSVVTKSEPGSEGLGLPDREVTARSPAPTRRHILDTFEDADGLPVTATFAAFMLEGGFTRYIEAQNDGGYSAWFGARWQEFVGTLDDRQPIYLPGRRDDRERFIDWLDNRATDHVARNVVEAA